jgi:hypothetical protein
MSKTRFFAVCWSLLALCVALPAQAQRLQLIEKNHQTPLAGQNVSISLQIDGATFAYDRLTSDAQGVIDLTEWLRAQAKTLQEYSGRASISLRVAGRRMPLSPEILGSPSPAPFRLEVNLGALRVSGVFVDEAGARVTQTAQLYPASIREYIAPSQIGAEQIRLYETGGAGEGKLVENFIGLNAGGFDLYLKPNTKYRFDAASRQAWTIANPVFTTGAGDEKIALTVRPKPYVLYGEFLDAKSGRPITETININGLDANFFGRGDARYALFFDAPRTVEMKVGSLLFQKEYREQAATVAVKEPLQRRDFSLEPLAGDPRTIDFRLQFTGAALEDAFAAVYLSGKDYFSQLGEKIGDKTYRFTLPQAGEYKLSINAPRYVVQAPAQLAIERDQTLEVPAVAKDTWVKVRVVDEAGRPIAFPKPTFFTLSEARVNCVLLDTPETVSPQEMARRERRLGLGYDVADVGGALRPDENGEVRFLLSAGGQFVLRARFENYRETTLPIEIKTHESKSLTLKPERRP